MGVLRWAAALHLFLLSSPHNHHDWQRRDAPPLVDVVLRAAEPDRRANETKTRRPAVLRLRFVHRRLIESLFSVYNVFIGKRPCGCV